MTVKKVFNWYEIRIYMFVYLSLHSVERKHARGAKTKKKT